MSSSSSTSTCAIRGSASSSSGQSTPVASHRPRTVGRQKLAGRKRYPLVLMLEPLFRCNLACAGCGKIQYPAHILKQHLTPEECFKAVDECGAGVPAFHERFTRRQIEPAFLLFRTVALEAVLDEQRANLFLEQFQLPRSEIIRLDRLSIERE